MMVRLRGLRKRMIAAHQHHHIFRHQALVLQAAAGVVVAQRAENEIDVPRAQTRDERFVTAFVGDDPHARIFRDHARDRFGQYQRAAERQRAHRHRALDLAVQCGDIVGHVA
jgi:hypothetical protein